MAYIKNLNNKIAQRLLDVIAGKKSRLCVSADLTKSQEILDLVERVGEHVCLIKTHIDIVEDFSWNFIEDLKALSEKHNFLIFEDRKFADIGNTVKLQASKGIYKIFDWADMVNAHIVPGFGIIEGLRSAVGPRECALILIAQMSSIGNLAGSAYTSAAVEMARESGDFTIGFIGNGSSPDEIKKLRALCGDDFLIFAPGINLDSSGDAQGQAYNTPSKAVTAGADVIIVGRGIYQAKDPAESAKLYKKESWIN